MKFVCVVFSLLSVTIVYAQVELTPPNPNATVVMPKTTEMMSKASVMSNMKEMKNGSEMMKKITQCHVGKIVNDEGIDNITTMNCDFSMGKACETKFESRASPNGDKMDFFSVVRECTQLEACENNAKNNDPKCYPGENNIRLCFFCCQDNLCNENIEIPKM